MSYDFESFRKALTDYSLDANKAITMHSSIEPQLAWQRMLEVLDDERRAALTSGELAEPEALTLAS